MKDYQKHQLAELWRALVKDRRHRRSCFGRAARQERAVEPRQCRDAPRVFLCLESCRDDPDDAELDHRQFQLSRVFLGAGGGKFRITTAASPSASDLYTQAASGAVIAASGPRVYTASYDSNMIGTGHGHVVNATGLTTDKLFTGPVATTPTMSDTGTGVITAGTHRAGYIIQTRSGFMGKISGITSWTAAGSKQANFSLTASLPTEATNVYPVITPASNLNRWFLIPNTSAAASGSINLTFSISDDDLVAADVLNEVTDNVNLWTQDGSGNAPFSPLAIGEYGFRTWYIADVSGQSTLIVSDPDDPQHITADQHVRWLPAFRRMRGAFSIGGMLYVGDSGWTYGFRDNGALPVEWPTPDLVDGSIGPYGPNCATVSASQSFALVANPQGLWLLQGGSYATRPLTYNVDPDWNRINWNGGGYNVRVVDVKDQQRAYVFAPLDSATLNTHMLTIDYTAGLTPEKIKFSPWDLIAAGYSSLGGGCVVQNPTTKIPELWFGTTSKVLRQNQPTDTNPYRDDTLGIDSQFETALLPGINGNVMHHYGAQIRAYGSGTLNGITYGVDRTVNSGAWALALAAAPGKMYIKRYPRVRSESASTRFTNGSVVDAYFVLSALDHLYSPGPEFR
jgi:hypothetical protein